MFVVTTSQMQAAEKAADARGLTYDQMMENAGRAVARAIEMAFEVGGAPVLVLVGPGNNGGDGLVVARHLAQAGAVVTVYAWRRNIESDSNWAQLDGTGVARLRADEPASAQQLAHLLNEAAIIVDALLGTGVSRPISGSLAELLEQTKAVVTTRRARVDGPLTAPARPPLEPDYAPFIVALDVPSGLNSDSGAVDPYTLPADLTVTLAAVKHGHILEPGPNVVGQLVVGDIGISRADYPAETTLKMATGAQVANLLPQRPATAHKGTFGTALIVAGSGFYTGAAILAAQSATRIGTGLVTSAPPQSIQPVVAARVTESTYLPLPDQDGFLTAAAVEVLRPKLEQVEALLIGPGLGNTDSTSGFLLTLLAEAAELPPLVLDADALNILAAQPEWWQLLPPESILTPHPGEMGRLTGQGTRAVQEKRLALAAEMAAAWAQVVVLKGAHTVIAAPDGRANVLPFANPGLAKAGSGDVLAGALVGLRAQGLPPFEAAVAAGYLHGLAGELASEQLGPAAVVAGDLVSLLPLAIREVTGQ